MSRDDKFHYDVSKLDQWQIVFDHAQQKGVYLHFKLQEQEIDDNVRGNPGEPARGGRDGEPARGGRDGRGRSRRDPCASRSTAATSGRSASSMCASSSHDSVTCWR